MLFQIISVYYQVQCGLACSWRFAYNKGFDIHCKISFPSHFSNCSPLTLEAGLGLGVAVDIDTLESVLDTIAFGDIQGEDTRNFTEANFVKIFRLAQLMVAHHWTIHLSFVPISWRHTTRTCCNFFLQIVQYIVSCNQVSA